MRKSRPLLAAASVCLLTVLTSCTSTRIASVWTDPEAEFSPFEKVVVLVIGRDQSLRQLAEDTFVRSLPSKVQGIPSYTLLPGEAMPELSAVRKSVNAVGADGVVVYRVVSVEKQQAYVPGSANAYPYYGTFGSYWSDAAPVVYDSGYVLEDQIVRVETNAYGVADEKLLWTAQSESLNPGTAQIVIDDVVLATIQEMRKCKLLP
jgi:hypothetical protein